MVCLKKDNSKRPPPPLDTILREQRPPHEDKAPCLWPPQGEKRPTTWRKRPHNVKKNPTGKNFQKEANAYYCLPPPPERPCMALLQYYNNAREISSSPPTPHPHNEIVIFYNNVERRNTQYPSLGSHRKHFEAKFL